MSIAEKIRELRKLRGWTRAELAFELDVAPGTVGCWEREERRPHKHFAHWIEAELLKARRSAG